MQVIVNNLITSYTRTGKGNNTIVFLHGWADSGKTFEQLVKQVHIENPSHSIVTVDLPGFGGTQAPPIAWGLDDYAAFVSQFLAKAKITPHIIVGHSNGGAIAIYGLANGVMSAKKLVLIASAGVRQDTAKKQTLRLLSKPAKLALNLAPKTTQKRIRGKLYGAIGSDYLVAEHMQETFKKVVSTDVLDDARKLTVPTCLIYGEIDDATPVPYGQAFEKAIPTAQLHIVPLSGHFVHQEQVYKVATIIKGFIES